MPTDLSIVIVNMNGCHVLRPCLASIFRETKEIDFEVVVVDNASKDGSREMLADEFGHVTVVCSDTNLGFAAANNLGIPHTKGKYVLLLNPDTEVLNGALQKTVAFMSKHPHTGVSGCKLLYPDHRIQETVRTFPDVWNAFSEAFGLYLLFPRSRTFGRYYLRYFDYSLESKVDWVLGAFFMIRRELLQKIGLLDEQFFMYTEEVDYCFRARQAGYDVSYNPDAEVIHYWGGQNLTNVKLIVWLHRSQMLYLKKHFRGRQRYLALLWKTTGVALRIVPYALFGICTLSKRYLIKSYAYALSFVQLLVELSRS